MVGDYRWFHDYEVAMLEHEFISENDVLESDGEFLKWYLAGVHDFAAKMIEIIRKKEEEE